MTTKPHTTFGIFIPQGWKMELVSIPEPTDKWKKTVEVAQLAEKLGFDSIWVYDHFHNVPRPAHETVFECWTVMSAISQLTSTIRLGQMVGCNLYREPSLLAKITSTLDVISGGRLDWGIGAGWYENECRGYGYDFPEPKVRIAMLRECVEIVRSMWTQEETTYDGKYALVIFSGFQRMESGVFVFRQDTLEQVGYMPNYGGHHDCVIVPSTVEQLKYSRSCTV